MGKTVLFIDDDEFYLYILKRKALKMEEVSDVLMAKNGKDALLKLKEWHSKDMPLPHVMFVDINMPVMNGLDFLDEFKSECEQNEKFKNIKPIVMLTSSADDSDKEKASKTGLVQEYIIKPAGTKEIESMLKSVLS